MTSNQIRSFGSTKPWLEIDDGDLNVQLRLMTRNDNYSGDAGTSDASRAGIHLVSGLYRDIDRSAPKASKSPPDNSVHGRPLQDAQISTIQAKPRA